MTAGTAGEQPPRAVSLDFDTTVAHPSRVYDYWLGGKDNFAADREAAERVLAVTPGLRMRVQANRAFLVRAVRFLAGPADRPAASAVPIASADRLAASAVPIASADRLAASAVPIASAGVSQFLDIGTGIPSANNTHEVAQSVNPAARIVYVDNDPIVLAHARALLTSAKGGATDYVQADLRNPEPILEAAARTLDFEQPIAIILLGVLHLVQDEEDPWGIVRRLMAAVPTGSYLAISHPALDIHPAQAEAQRRYNERVSTPQTLRTRDQVARFFTDLELVEPGLVQVHQWRPDPNDVVPEDAASAHGAVARKR